WACNSPVLCLTGQIFDNQLGKNMGALHEIPDQLGMIGHIAKWTASVNTPPEAPAAVQEAFRQLTSGRPRPVVIEMPPGVMGEPGDVTLLDPASNGAAPELDEDALDKAAKILGGAKYPIIFAGGGTTEAGEALKQLAETLQAPVIMTPAAKGVLSDRHPLALSLLGGHKIWDRADAVLAVGTRFDRPLLDWGIEGLQIVRMDIDPEEFDRVTPPAVGIVADAERGLAALANKVERHNGKRDSRNEEIAAVKEQVSEELFEKGQPQASIAEVIRQELPDDGRFVGDVTQVAAFADIGFPVYEPRTFITSGFQGTLGYGYATSLGVKVGCPDVPVVSINGDGGFLYTMSELATAQQHGIGVVAIVFNDGAYGNVKAIQRTRYGGREIASTLENPDFVTVAKAFNIAGRRAETPEQLREALREGFASNAPMLIDYPTAPMPMVRQLSRGKVRG
ncbi:MAG TPA: thiamine pyrophosphate-dependent enzyme, partial [Thermomicrobiales bacterium]|nr:thiamine pyrophosphate-dependent enzyme [Thermomicrobiales bacterium]